MLHSNGYCAEYKQYRSLNYGFTLYYPEDCTIEEDQPLETERFKPEELKQSIHITYKRVEKHSILVRLCRSQIKEKPATLETVEANFRKDLGNNIYGFSELLSRYELVIDDKKAICLIVENRRDPKYIDTPYEHLKNLLKEGMFVEKIAYWFFIDNGKIYEFSCNFTWYEKDFQIAEDIVKSIKIKVFKE